MSRCTRCNMVLMMSFPRLRGDEPDFVDGGVKSLEFSPPTRG